MVGLESAGKKGWNKVFFFLVAIRAANSCLILELFFILKPRETGY